MPVVPVVLVYMPAFCIEGHVSSHGGGHMAGSGGSSSRNTVLRQQEIQHAETIRYVWLHTWVVLTDISPRRPGVGRVGM